MNSIERPASLVYHQQDGGDQSVLDDRRVEVREHWDKLNPETSASFEECRASGRPFVCHDEDSRTFRYFYFDHSRSPTPELLDQLGQLASLSGLLHHHVSTGHGMAECCGSRLKIQYQGQFQGEVGSLTEERRESFLTQLAQLLPGFDRQGVIESLVTGAMSTGYLMLANDPPFGDHSLIADAWDAYIGRSEANASPAVIIEDYKDFVYYRHGKTLSSAAVARIATLAYNHGISDPGDQNDDVALERLENGGPEDLWYTDFEGFAGQLHEIVSDPQSYELQPA